MNKELWLQFENSEDFLKKESLIYDVIKDNYGGSQIMIYDRCKRAIKRLPSNKSVHIDDGIIESLESICGKDNVKVFEKHEPYLEPEEYEPQSIDRIADALEEIRDSLDLLTSCIGYAPPRHFQKEGYHFLRIYGDVITE